MIRRVLFLDDDEDLRTVTAAWLEGHGIVCDAVATVAELEAAMASADGGFDAIILDINLGPGKPSGVDAYRWLRERGFGGHIAFLTGHAHNHPLVAEALRAGDAAVYEKPVSAATLERLLAGAAP